MVATVMRGEGSVQGDGRGGLGAFRAEREGAPGLPAHAFESLAFQRLEDAAIWTLSWVGIGFAAEVARPGDVLPFTIGNHGIHVERLDDGSLVGRFNKAQHGGCRTVPQQCQTGSRTRCSFTACGYSYDRRPIAADDPDRARHLDQYLGLRPERLLPVDLRQWGPLLMARLDPRREAGSNRSQTTPWLTSLKDGGGLTTWQEYDANWKHLAVALASPGASSGLTSLLFPNVILREGAGAACLIVLQPVARVRTLCRIRCMDGCDTNEVLAWVAARGCLAKDMQMRRGGLAAAAVDPIRASFENQVSAAIGKVEAERRSDLLFKTADTGEW